MDTQIFSALEEWARLESMHHEAKIKQEGEAVDLDRSMVSAKELEILEMRPQTKAGALVQLHFCATFLERNSENGHLAARAIRGATSVFGW
ncbi:hypothetical protein [Methylocystis sp. ATCC 49242]|uniref:hypothetical protein n=1 Tax=Methylocystis sp. ATCC 49242 TaxID=622637 RepID=UPI0001F86CD8|nr:hypothetical protein [Methylocystis sp. ATCC 49242]